MNRKNPGLVEPELLSQEEEHNYSLYYAIGWTIAAFVYTIYCLWQGVRHHSGVLELGWLLAAIAWGNWWHERHKMAKM